QPGSYRDHVVPLSTLGGERLLEPLLGAVIPVADISLLFPAPIFLSTTAGPGPIGNDLAIHGINQCRSVYRAIRNNTIRGKMSIMRSGLSDIGHRECSVDNLIHAGENTRSSVHKWHLSLDGRETNLRTHIS